MRSIYETPHVLFYRLIVTYYDIVNGNYFIYIYQQRYETA